MASRITSTTLRKKRRSKSTANSERQNSVKAAIALAEAAHINATHALAVASRALEINTLLLAKLERQRLLNQHSAKRRRSDALQETILLLVNETPDITQRLLERGLAQLAEGDGDTIQEVTETDVCWRTRSGEEKNTSLSALKDRLHRAKEELRAYFRPFGVTFDSRQRR